MFIANTPNTELSGQPGSGLPGPGLPGPGLPGQGQPESAQPGSGQPGSGQAESGLSRAPSSSSVTPPVNGNNGRQVVVGSNNRMTGISLH